MTSNDHYKYPGEDILVNEFDCHNVEELNVLEALSTGANLAYLQLHQIRGRFDFKHLRDIHKFIFQDVYKWAGEIRDVDIGKGNLFCRAQYIEEYAESVFSSFYSSCFKVRKDRKLFIETLAEHYGNLNALHPFREGNGRSQREFVRELCLNCGYVLDLTSTTHDEMLEASIESFNLGDNSGFIRIFFKCIIPTKEYMNLQENLGSKLLILSDDDISTDFEKSLF